MEKTMDMDVQKIKKQIEILANNLQSLRDLVTEELPDLPDKAKQRLVDKLCLYCGKPLEEPPKRTIRGNHEKCYKSISRSIKAGETTEFKAIAIGFLSHPEPGGRPENEPVYARIARMEEVANSEKKKPDSRKKTTTAAKALRKAKANKPSASLRNSKGE